MSTVKANNFQHPSSPSVNMVLDSAGGASFADNVSVDGVVGMSSAYYIRNRLINGAFAINQRNSGTLSISSSTKLYPVDRFFAFGNISSGAFTIQATNTSPPTGFLTSLLCTTTTADTSLLATSQFQIGQNIEGYNVADLLWGTADAKPITLSFWVKCSAAGLIGGSVRNIDNTRSYPFAYTVNNANTWEKKVITIPGDTTGTWNTTNDIGLSIGWAFAIGTTYQSTADTWAAGTFYAPTGSLNLLATLSTTLSIAAPQLEVGTAETAFERRPFGQELNLCQRYYFNGSNPNNSSTGIFGALYSTTAARVFTRLPVTMRAAPTSALSASIVIAPSTNALGTAGSGVFSVDGAAWDITALVTSTIGVPVAVRTDVAFSAEL